MKRLSVVLSFLLASAFALPAFAHGQGGWRVGYVQGGGYYGGGFHHHRHQGWHHGGNHGANNWVGPVLGAAIVGSAIYAARSPAAVTTYVSPPVVVMQSLPQRVAYYCSTWGQYYPAVQSCPEPWQPVGY